MAKCIDCKYCLQIDYGYSNWTVEGTTVYCLLNLNPKLPEDRFFGGEPALEFANECKMFTHGDSVQVDVDREFGNIEDYSDDLEIKHMLKYFRE